MNTLVITGTGLTGPAGYGPVPVPAAPSDLAFLAAGFDAEGELGRRTTGVNHRSTLLALAACGAAIRDARLTADVLAARWTTEDAGLVLALDSDGLAGVAILTGPPGPSCPSTSNDPTRTKEQSWQLRPICSPSRRGRHPRARPRKPTWTSPNTACTAGSCVG